MTPTFVGQFDEDRILWEALDGAETGRYVDVGCCHPETGSVSWVFYQAGWQGVTVDAVAENVDLHRLYRPRDFAVHAAVMAADRVPVVLHDFGRGISTVSGSVAAFHRSAGRNGPEITVMSRTLDSILVQAGWARGVPIGFVSVDVEGAEADVFAGFDLAGWAPRFLMVEATFPCTDVPAHDRWEPGVLDCGYALVGMVGVNRFYRRT